MGSTGLENLQPGDERAYEAMAQAVRAGVSGLLVPFKAAANAEALLRAMSIEEFFQKFLAFADKFSEGCCLDYAKIIRQCASVQEVRGTPTATLAKEVRKQVFENLDKILVSYIQAVRQLGFEMSIVSAALTEISLSDAALRGAAIGQLAGGFGSSGKTLASLNAAIQAGAEAEKKLVLLKQKIELLKQAQEMTLPKIKEYLEAVQDLPERLLDYGCAKCFGGQVSFDRQQSAVEAVQGDIRGEIETALQLVSGLPKAEALLEQQRLKEAEEQRKQKELESKRRSPAVAIISIVIAIGLVIGSLQSWKAGGSEDNAYLAIFLFIGAISGFVYGLMRCFDRRPKGLRSLRGIAEADASAGAGSERQPRPLTGAVASLAPKAASKKCSWCGKEYPSDATMCSADGQPLESA